MKHRAQHVAAELELTMRELSEISRLCLGLHISNVNLLLSDDQVRRLREFQRQEQATDAGR